MNIVAVDTETTIHNTGNPYDSRNKLVCVSTYPECPLAVGGPSMVGDIRGADLFVGFNFKFDLHWLTKHGFSYNPAKIWDVQIAEFILSNQTNRFPSLEETCQKYGIPGKKNVVKEEYWDKGINTDEIPWDILSEYAAHDAYVTYLCYHEQIKLMTPAQIRLCQLQCQDMSILMEMERNGLKFDEELCRKRAVEIDQRIEQIRLELDNLIEITSSKVAR